MNYDKFIDPFRGIEASNWILALTAAVISFIAIHGVVILFRRHLNKLSENGRADRPAAELLKATLARTSNFAIFVTSLLIGLTLLDLDAKWDERLSHLWFIALGAQLALYLDRAVSVVAKQYFRRHNESPDSPATVAHTLVIWAIKTMLWVMFGLAMLSNLGINVTTFVASLGIGGIAVALAAQNILGDLFASLSIVLDKPFVAGDFIVVGDALGTVENIGLKTTRLRGLGGEQIVFSNNELLKSRIHNQQRMQTRRVAFVIRVSYQSTEAQLRSIPDMVREAVESEHAVMFERSHFFAWSESSVDFETVYHVQSADYLVHMNTQQAIFLGIFGRFANANITFAHPTRVVQVINGSTGETQTTQGQADVKAGTPAPMFPEANDDQNRVYVP